MVGRSKSDVNAPPEPSQSPERQNQNCSPVRSSSPTQKRSSSFSVVRMVSSFSGADPWGGGSLGSDEPPQRQRNFIEAILVGRGLNLVR